MSDAAELARLIQEAPWMVTYAEGLPIQFTAEQQELREALADFCWAGSWAKKYLAAKSNPCERMVSLAHENGPNHPVHGQISHRKKEDIDLLKKCSTEGIEKTLMDVAGRYVVGVW